MQNAIRSWKDFKTLLQSPSLPDIGPTPRTDRFALAELNHKVDDFIEQTHLDSTVQPLVRSAALLWHDYLDESHTISQNIHNADGSFLHAIMHRREPDYGNAKYWFHRVGEHPSFPDIVGQVVRWLKNSGEKDLITKLVPDGRWDPFSFVDACSEAMERPVPSQRIEVLKAVQQIEFETFLAHVMAD